MALQQYPTGRHIKEFETRRQTTYPRAPLQQYRTKHQTRSGRVSKEVSNTVSISTRRWQKMGGPMSELVLDATSRAKPRKFPRSKFADVDQLELLSGPSRQGGKRVKRRSIARPVQGF